MDKRYRSWCFTLNNPTISPTSLISLLSDGKDTLKIVFQRERGEQKTEHFQGVVQYRHQVAFKTLKSLDPAIHWEPCKNLRASLNYCSKADTRVEGPWTVGWDIPEPLRTIEQGDFNDWQKQTLSIVDGPTCDRSVYWYWEQSGGVGKTAFTKWCAVHRSALVVSGKSADIKFAVAQWIRQRRRLGLAIFSFTRSVENFISYEAIEAIKDGIFFSGKYEGGMCLYDPPTVICFANFPPDIDKLSLDRWRIFHIVGGQPMPDLRTRGSIEGHVAMH